MARSLALTAILRGYAWEERRRSSTILAISEPVVDGEPLDSADEVIGERSSSVLTASYHSDVPGYRLITLDVEQPHHWQNPAVDGGLAVQAVTFY